jgi:hypothetical protein
MPDLSSGDRVPPFQAREFLGYEPNSSIGSSFDFEQVFATALRLGRENWVGICVIALIFGFLPEAVQPYIGNFDDIKSGVWFVTPDGLEEDLSWFDIVIGILSMMSSGYVTLMVLSNEANEDIDLGHYVRVTWPVILLSLLAFVGVVLGLVLLVVPGVLLALAWAVALPVLINEKLGVIASLKRSSQLSAGSGGQVFWVYVGLLVCTSLLVWLGTAFGEFILDLTSIAGSSGIFESLMTSIADVGSSLLFAALYLYLRTRKEGPQTKQLADIFE